MITVSNDVLNKFLNYFISALNAENDNRKQNKINIPFVISSLYQSFNNDKQKYNGFISDLEDYPDYNIFIKDSNNEYNGIIDVEISLAMYDDDNIEDPYYEYPDYSYIMYFSSDTRYYGYCQCTSDMPDYREDKHCCGRGCDDSFCSFSLHKVLNIVSDSWHGDEYDYWEFEDEFYASDKELADKKKEEDRVREIEELKNRISADSKRLAELTSGGFPVGVRV